jgi:hypothetical protein
MSITAVSSSSSLSQSLQAWQARSQKIQSEFQQLGQDLQAGNLTQAKSDFSTLSSNLSGPLQSNSTLAQAFSSLGSALQSGSVSAAQQAYSTLQQGVQQVGHHFHQHGHTENSLQPGNSSTTDSLSQVLGSLGSALQSGNLSAAQTAYSTLQQDLAQFGMGSSSNSTSLAGALSFMG